MDDTAIKPTAPAAAEALKFEHEYRKLRNDVTRIGLPQGIESIESIESNASLSVAEANSRGNASKVLKAYAELAQTNDLPQACNALLLGIRQLMPTLARGAAFIPDLSGEGLTLAATTTLGTSGQFQITAPLLKKAYKKRREQVIQTNDSRTSFGLKHIYVLPILRIGAPLCIIHLECENSTAEGAFDDLDSVRLFLSVAAPLFESLTLKQVNEAWFLGMVETVNTAIEAKDTYTSGHSERVGRFALAVASELEMSQVQKKWLLASSLCHDIGKIGISDGILRKPAMLSADEYEEMKTHPLVGEGIIKHLPNADAIIAGIKFHHERWDGTGYPHGLAGEEIPLVARIIAIADAFDAMTSGRAYSGYIDESEAVAQLCAKEDLFDPNLLESFGEAHNKGKLSLRTGTQIGPLKTTA